MPLVFIYNPNSLTGCVVGGQIGKYLNCEFTKGTVTHNDTVILVKTDLDFTSTSSNKLPKLIQYATDDIKHFENCIVKKGYKNIIVHNKIMLDYLKNYSFNEIHLIKHHHCNFENVIKANIDRPFTVGYIGSVTGIDYNLKLIASALRDYKIELGYLCTDEVHEATREDICNVYKNFIDVQISFRKEQENIFTHPSFACSVKLANAGSFMIPTVSYPSIVYKDEFDKCFFEVNNLEELINACVTLRDNKNLYNELANNAYERSKEYHISTIANLFKELEQCH